MLIHGNSQSKLCEKGKGERATAKANIRYIQERPGRDKENSPGRFLTMPES